MAAKKELTLPVNDGLTFTVAEKKEEYTGPRVTIFLPELEDPGSEGLKVDQYEHVTIANEVKETNYRIHRGEWVEVPVPVYVQLKNKYPKL
jgi:hypothetical protein